MAAKRPSKPSQPAKPKAPARPRAKAYVEGEVRATKPKATMPVHALGDERIHLAPAQPGRLRQGYLKTLCGLQAVSALSPFALADDSRKRCRTCFSRVDENGRFAG